MRYRDTKMRQLASVLVLTLYCFLQWVHMETGDPEFMRLLTLFYLELTSKEEISGLINHLIGLIGHSHQAWTWCVGAGDSGMFEWGPSLPRLFKSRLPKWGRTLVDKWPVTLWMNQEPTNGDWLPKGDKFYKYYKDKSFADWLFEDIFGWFQDDSLWLMIYLDLMDLDLMDVRFLIWESWVYFCNSEQWGFLGTWVIMPLS